MQVLNLITMLQVKKATKITTEDGKVYRLIADRNGLQAGSKPATGKVERKRNYCNLPI